MTLSFAKHEKIWLKTNPAFSEKWLQDLVVDDPSILGLGEVNFLDRERIQERSGRLDLLLSDGDTRYEIEIMLGATDPSHIIRCLEYWDIERRRFPGYEHIAVLIAEDITSRFLNIMSLMAGTIPLIAIQLNALKVGDQVVLDFVHVLDQTSLRQDDEPGGNGEEVDRSYLEGKVGQEIMGIADELLVIVNEVSEKQYELSYRKDRARVSDPGNWRNLVALFPKKKYAHVGCNVSNAASWVQQFEEIGLTVAASKRNRLRITIRPNEIAQNRELFSQMLKDAIDQYQHIS